MIMRETGLLVLCLSFISISVKANPTDSLPRKKYFTQRLKGSITLDGIPDEEAWNAVEWGGDFIVYQPNEGSTPSQPSRFKILYDDRYLYIAYRCDDSAPDSI